MWMIFLHFNRTYIIQYKEKCDSKINEKIRHIPVITPSGFTIKIHESICYMNLTLQAQYQNIIFIEMILNIDCEYILNQLDTDDHDFILNQQKVVILEELQKIFGQIYIGRITQLSLMIYFT